MLAQEIGRLKTEMLEIWEAERTVRVDQRTFSLPVRFEAEVENDRPRLEGGIESELLGVMEMAGRGGEGPAGRKAPLRL